MKKRIIALSAVVVATASTSAFAATEGGFQPIFDAIDLSGISSNVVSVGVIAVGIAVAFKAISLAKRAVGRA